jgi:hypothetical protein
MAIRDIDQTVLRKTDAVDRVSKLFVSGGTESL